MFFGTFVLAQKTPVAGGDRDVHGCISSAVYGYSKIEKKCVRIFEQENQLTKIDSKKGSN